MNKRTKIILLVLAILIILALVLFLSEFSKPFCGTTFHVRNAQTGQCELKVGCSLPAGVVEDPSCISILKEQVDGNKSS